MSLKFSGLEDFLYPEKKRGYNDNTNKIKLAVISRNSVMKPYYCMIHKIYFWKNTSNDYGYCGQCKGFFEQIHFPLDSEEYKIEVDNMVEVKQSISLKDGKYEGEIIELIERTKPYEYTDFVVEVNVGKKKVKIKHGVPTAISVNDDGKPTTALSKLLTSFGMKFEIGKDITLRDMEKSMVGKKCNVMIENEDTEKGIFAKIISLKPA